MDTPKRIVVIDDDVDILEAAKLTLEGAGYDVATAATGAEGMDLVRTGGADLVILDVMMETDTEGFRVAQEINGDPELADIPVLMLTSVSEKTGFAFDPETDGDYLPVEQFVEKPIRPDELVDRVRRLLKD